MILVDTSVLLDLATEDNRWFAWSARQVAWFGDREILALTPIIYAELAVKSDHRSELDARLEGWNIQPIDLEIAWRAAKAHAEYRSQGGKRERILGDFWVGAHAEVKGLKLLTRNPPTLAGLPFQVLSHLAVMRLLPIQGKRRGEAERRVRCRDFSCSGRLALIQRGANG